ncbi:MAG: OmpH family outer membrane protein [Pelosinus sp.]|nr:OmpH family outer membrane protein [Pelosinus sp.]
MSKLKTIILSAFVLFAVIAFANPVTTYAAQLPIAVANYQQLINQHPDMAQANETYKAAVKQAQDEYKEKSANMSDDEKKAYSQKLDQELQQKKIELLNAIRDKVNAAVKEVADSKGIAMVIDKSVDIYGGQDITDDVLKKITGK